MLKQESLMISKLQLLCAIGLLASVSAAHAQKLCVYDPLGAQGDGYSLMKDYALAAKQWGADITLKPYTDDQKANEDYKDGKCDGLSTVGIRMRQFNTFTGTVDAIGGVPDEAVAKVILTLIANPKLAADMQTADGEIVGVSSLGFAYPISSDRNVNSMAKMSGKRFGALSFDRTQIIMGEKMGCNVIPVTLTNIASKFNSGDLDVVALPAFAIKAFELTKGLGNKGAIARYAVAFITYQTIIHPAKFPDGFGAQSRAWVITQMPRQFKTTQRLESGIEPRYWMELPPADKSGYDKLIRQARLGMTNEGIYNKRMNGILKKIRCLQNPTNYECPLKDE
jgi:hypothetical protein